MLYHSTMLQATGMGNYGVSMSMSMRADIITMYSRLMLEIGQYVEDVAQLSIEKEWMDMQLIVKNDDVCMAVNPDAAFKRQ